MLSYIRYSDGIFGTNSSHIMMIGMHALCHCYMCSILMIGMHASRLMCSGWLLLYAGKLVCAMVSAYGIHAAQASTAL